MFKLALAGAAVGALSILGIVAGATGAGAIPIQPIGPNQFFGAEVNFSTGVSQPVPIKVDCPSPVVFLGETGHPLPGQSVEVTPSPTTNSTNIGFTGAYANEIGAFFGVVPPSPTAAAPIYVPITAYNEAVPIPTSLNLPCYGTSQVNFVPLPQDPGVSRAATVPVVYEATCPSLVCPV